MTDKFLHLITRSSAKAAGLKRFFLPEPCKNGHVAERNTKSTTCIVCDKERKLEYRKNSPEKTRASVNRSRQKYKAKHAEIAKRWREKNKGYLQAAKKQYVENNKEKVRLSKRRYYLENKDRCLLMSKMHKEKHADRYKAIQKEWRKNNKELIRANNRNRKSKLRNAEGSHTHKDVMGKYHAQGGMCAGCRKKVKYGEFHVDHIVPLALGGTNWPSNIQILCPSCNMSKGGRPPEHFYQKLGYLL